MPSDKPIFTLRIDEDLLEKVKVLAGLNSRSVNREIEYALKQHIAAYESLHGPVGS